MNQEIDIAYKYCKLQKKSLALGLELSINSGRFFIKGDDNQISVECSSLDGLDEFLNGFAFGLEFAECDQEQSSEKVIR